MVTPSQRGERWNGRRPEGLSQSGHERTRLTSTDSEALLTSSNYVRSPVVTANIIYQSTSARGVSEKRGTDLFFDSRSAMLRSVECHRWEAWQNAIPPNDAPNPPIDAYPAGPYKQTSICRYGPGLTDIRTSEMKAAWGASPAPLLRRHEPRPCATAWFWHACQPGF